MRIDILTLFPEMFTGPFGVSILNRAQNEGLINIELWNIRHFATDKHNVVDDTPYGGGAGMVLKVDVISHCIEEVKRLNQGPVIYLSPQGEQFTQKKADKMARLSGMILLCGHYEGIDERVRQLWVDEELSIGDYVLTGGELPAMVIADAVSRLIPGVLGHNESAETDSFSDGLLEHPHYTRPANFRNLEVPQILLSGHHQKIQQWRKKESLRRTLLRRPDLLRKRNSSQEELKLLTELYMEND